MLHSKQGLFVISLTIAGLLLAACGGGAATPSPAAPPTMSPATQAPASGAGGQVTVSAADSSLGTILVDGKGMTLYLLTGDSADASICTDACATAWPPLIGTATAGSGVDGTKLGTISRPDGTSQVTYNGHPLYGFVKDQAAGDVNGQGINKFGGIWYVVSPSGDAITESMSSGAASGGSSAGVEVATGDSSFGKILVDAQGMSLYLLTTDSPDQSTCTDTCATNWPPMISSGQVSAGSGADASLLGSLTRPDGSTQVTYNGHPLYTFKGDHAAGDVAGQGIGGKWYLLSPAGEPIQATADSGQPTSSYSQY
jgi:predicted lipoprotein with Yx(FWY)xxD motif